MYIWNIQCPYTCFREKGKFYVVNSHVGTSKFVVFTRDTKNIRIFLQNLCANIECEMNMGRFFLLFYILERVFKRGVHMHREPNWISDNIFNTHIQYTIWS
jgi:hypothetical protein